MRRLLPLALLGLALTVAAGCGADTRPPAVRQADQAFEAYGDRPSPVTFGLFIRANRKAAMDHGEPNDEQGILFQARALEVQSLEAVRTGDGDLAAQVAGRVDELEGLSMLELYEERLPGIRERIRASRERVAALTR